MTLELNPVGFLVYLANITPPEAPYIYIYIYIYIRGSLNKFPDFFRMVIFIDSTHMRL